ncbi:hypothetical protein CcaCcLH18_09780 [Colletotrichum camelliae]|nr:hypothetical protein CcaCcLH18_09780 [Colletotrichum camelliae]
MASEKHRDSTISTIISKDLNTGTHSRSQSAELQCPPLSETRAAVCHAVEPPSTISTLLTGWWYIEITCMILSFAVFGLYCWFLSSWEGYRVSDWNRRVPKVFSSFFIKNLGSAASSFITILKVLSFIPITASMGQLKWHYFLRRYSRPVAELETFDAASRSVSGSIKLLVSGNRFHSIHITLGCLLTLATLYLGSSTQNTITSPSEEYWSPEGVINKTEIAQLPVTEVFNVTARRDILGVDNQNFSEDPGIQAALFTAWSFYQNPQFVNQEINPVSANCSSTYC